MGILWLGLRVLSKREAPAMTGWSCQEGFGRQLILTRRSGHRWRFLYI